MLTQTLRLALRRLARQPGTTALHVGGLAVGLACCFLAGLYVRDELAYDRFHDGAERIVEVRQAIQLGERVMRFRSTPEGGVEVLRDGTAGVQAVAQTDYETGLVRTAPGQAGVEAEEVRFADGAFFDVFSFPLVQGDARTALDGPGQTVLTASFAQTLFGDADVVGETVYLERTGFGLTDPEPLALTVTGVAADPPGASTFQFEMLVSGQTPIAVFEGTKPAIDPETATYVRLASVSDTVAVKAALDPIALSDSSHFADWGERQGVMTPRFVDGHLSGDRWTLDGGLSGQRFALGLFATIAGLVLLLACVNYANLATALAATRSVEIGVRKAIGASRGRLTGQLLAEAVLLALAAGALAVLVAGAALPAFNAFFDKRVAMGDVPAWGWAAALGLVLVTGLVAGLYPAAVLARFQPVEALRGRPRTGGVTLRRGLVVFQFAVTAALLGGTAVVWQQLSAARTTDLGFEGDRVVALDLSADRLDAAGDRLKQQMLALPGVTSASLTSFVPGATQMQMTMSPGSTNADATDDLTATQLQADADLPATLGLTMAAGAWVPDGAGFSDAVVLNETAARQLGLMTTDPAQAIGQTVGFGSGSEAQVEVVGVLRDFHYDGPRVAIGPLAALPMTEFHNTQILALQLASPDARTLDAVREVWTREVPEYAFAPEFVSDSFAAQLRQDRQLGQLFALFGGVAVALACLGVFGLAAHAADRRRKEFGVRKVLGATVAGLVARLSGEFAALVAVALAAAGPLVWWGARRWLEGFAYPASLDAWPFVLVGLGVLALALSTVAAHAVRAATADPVHALRSE